MNPATPSIWASRLVRCASLAAICLSLAALPSRAQEESAPPPPPGQTVAPAPANPSFSPEDIKQLVAPIALYPDALIALILPASTVPSDIVLADRFVNSKGDPQQIPNQSWDPSVKSLAAYPQVLSWMDQNLDWTTSLGEAFTAQPADVMNSVQELRAEAKAKGNLVDTPQQKVVQEEKVIRIVPAEPDYIYAPQYDPEVVYSQPYSADVGPLVVFGAAFAVGPWLNYDCDWGRREVYYGDWQPGWHYDRHHGGGNYYGGGGNQVVNVVNINEVNAKPWEPSARSRVQLNQHQSNFTRANVQTASGVVANNARVVPRPSQPRFHNQGSAPNGGWAGQGNRHQGQGQPQNVPPGRVSSLNPSNPPNVKGQQGKPMYQQNNGQHGPHQPNPQGNNNLPPAPQKAAPGTDNLPGNAKNNGKPAHGANSGNQPVPQTQAPKANSNNGQPHHQNVPQQQPKVNQPGAAPQQQEKRGNSPAQQHHNQAPSPNPPPAASNGGEHHGQPKNSSPKPAEKHQNTPSHPPQAHPQQASKPQEKHQNPAPQQQHKQQPSGNKGQEHKPAPQQQQQKPSGGSQGGNNGHGKKPDKSDKKKDNN